MESLTVPASMEHLYKVMSLTEQLLEQARCGKDDKRLVEISVEEIYTNIASYAYGGGEGQIWLQWDIRAAGEAQREIAISFQDQGRPYNPFAREDPDLTLPIEERPVGGLGIYMVKQFMDQVDYRYEQGCNKTTILKRFQVM